MSRELVPMKVKIGLRDNGMAKYPDFNQLQIVKDSGLDWAKYIDVMGLGWHYDKTSGHKEDSVDSPFGQQWGVVVVPKPFVDEAISTFPDECNKLTETELEEFYDNKAHKHEPDEKIDSNILEGIKLKQDLGLTLTTEQTKALDPNDDTPGITANKKKKWADFKKIVNVKIVQ